MTHIVGFVSWAFQILEPPHTLEFASEWQCVQRWFHRTMHFFVDADACCVATMANAAFYMHYPLPQTMKQNPPPTTEDLIKAGYLSADGSSVLPRSYTSLYGR